MGLTSKRCSYRAISPSSGLSGISRSPRLVKRRYRLWSPGWISSHDSQTAAGRSFVTWHTKSSLEAAASPAGHVAAGSVRMVGFELDQPRPVGIVNIDDPDIGVDRGLPGKEPVSLVQAHR